MNIQATLTISAAVVALVQMSKWMGLPIKYAPVAIFGWSLLWVLLWGVSQPAESFVRTQIFDYASGWLAISLSAAGVYGFTRTVSDQLTTFKSPGGGQ